MAPSFLSPFDVAPAGAPVADMVGQTPVIVDYWRLIVRERRHLLVPVVLLVLAAGEQLVALAEAAVEWLLPVALAAEAAEAAVE